MTMTDPIADMLTRIRNAAMAQKDDVSMPTSKLKEQIALILDREGYIGSFRVEGDGPKRILTIELKYGPDRERAITGVRRISKPGRRVYTARGGLPRVQGGLGLAIVSTSQGVLTDRQAAKRGIGGEILAYVW
jgi:small subunit ribosomal protein S8